MSNLRASIRRRSIWQWLLAAVPVAAICVPLNCSTCVLKPFNHCTRFDCFTVFEDHIWTEIRKVPELDGVLFGVGLPDAKGCYGQLVFRSESDLSKSDDQLQGFLDSQIVEVIRDGKPRPCRVFSVVGYDLRNHWTAPIAGLIT